MRRFLGVTIAQVKALVRQSIATLPIGGGGMVQGMLQQLTPADEGSVTGDARGSRAVDLGMIRSFSSQVAKGASSALLAGQNCQTVGARSATVGGQNNISSANDSVAHGTLASASRYGEIVHGCGQQFGVVGAFQSGSFVASAQTLNASLTELKASASGGLFSLVSGDVVRATVTVVASDINQDRVACWKAENILVFQPGGFSTTVLENPLTFLDLAPDVSVGTASLWRISVSAAGLGYLRVEVSGELGVTIRWSAQIQYSQVNF